MSRPSAATFHREVAGLIVQQLRSDGAAPGTLLSENLLARALNISRSPIRGALQLLLDAGSLTRSDNGRIVLVRLPGVGEPATQADRDEGTIERLYWQVAADRLAGRLPDLSGEAELMRRYDVPRGVIGRMLRQIMAEGWVEPAPAGKWLFLPLIDGPESYDESYRFRRIMEPAALNEPGYTLPTVVLQRLRREQEYLTANVSAASPREIFELNSGFHLALTEASRNRFLVDAALRIIRLRRVVGYVIALDRDRLAVQSTEHLEILSLLEAGRQQDAATCLLRHLDNGRSSKARLLERSRLELSGLVPTLQCPPS